MKIPVIGERQWKIVLCAALLLFAAIWLSAAANWRLLMVPGAAGTLHITTDKRSGHTARLSDIDAGSPLAALGLKAGDWITYDNVSDASRPMFAAHEPVGITIGTGSARRHLTLKAEPVADTDPVVSMFYVLVMANALVALVLAGLIGLRRAASPSARVLALILLVEMSFAIQFMPGGRLLDFSLVVLSPLVAIVAYCGFFLFSCLFPNDASRHVPVWVRRVALPAMLCMIAYASVSAISRAGWDIVLPGSAIINFPLVSLIVTLSSVNLWHAYRSTAGAVRQRVQWVGIAIGVRFAAQVLGAIPAWSFVHSNIFAEGLIAVTILANIGLAYGVLRHRVFDVGFAVNRALVFGIVSVVLLVAFGLMEWLAHHFVSPEEAEKNALLDAGIALGLYLIFHRLRHSVDHLVERLFFHKWHVNEERLRRFVKQAAHITSADALIEACLAALQRFSGEAGCALYRRGANGYELARAAGLQAPQAIGIDDPLAVAMRAELAPLAPAECDSVLPGALALPMSFRGELQGFVLLGQKASRDAYRPDEIAVLDHAAHQVGLDLQALRTEQLQAEVAALRQELGTGARSAERHRIAASAA